MTDRRLELSALLNSLCDNVYFQEPGDDKLVYPAILYRPVDENRQHANNATYILTDEWQVTIIDRDPDSPLRQRYRMLQGVSFDRHFRTQGLNHFVYKHNY